MQACSSRALRCVRSVMLLFVALGTHVHASVPQAAGLPQMVVDTVMASDRMPAMDDCVPCAYCYSGPVSSVQGFSGEAKERSAVPWTTLAPAAVAPQRRVDNSAWLRTPVPVRITLCRWSN